MEGIRKVLREAYQDGHRCRVEVVTKSGASHFGSVTYLGSDHVILYTDNREACVVLLEGIESARMSA